MSSKSPFKNGVISAMFCRETMEFTDFLENVQDIVVIPYETCTSSCRFSPRTLEKLDFQNLLDLTKIISDSNICISDMKLIKFFREIYING